MAKAKLDEISNFKLINSKRMKRRFHWGLAPHRGEAAEFFSLVFDLLEKLRSASCLLLPVKILLYSSSYMIFSMSTFVFVMNGTTKSSRSRRSCRVSVKSLASCLCFYYVGMMETQNPRFCSCLHVVMLLISRNGKSQTWWNFKLQTY